MVHRKYSATARGDGATVAVTAAAGHRSVSPGALLTTPWSDGIALVACDTRRRYTLRAGAAVASYSSDANWTYDDRRGRNSRWYDCSYSDCTRNRIPHSSTGWRRATAACKR